MDDLQTIRKAAEIVGVDRNAVARWVKAGLLKGKPTKIGHLAATLVGVSELKRVAKMRPPGRPRKPKR